MKILLLGANGQLGRSFLEQGGLLERGDLILGTRDGTHASGREAVVADLATPNTLSSLLNRQQPDIVINTAAYTAVDKAEQDEGLASRVNGDAVGEIGNWAAANGALVIHYSTDYVFDGGQSTPYATDAETRPLGVYGRSKLLGEQALKASGANHLIMRTAWVYAQHGQNFLRTMLRIGAERDEIKVVADQHGAPTSADMIVNGTLVALDRWKAADGAERNTLQGVHHLVASGETTWHGFAEAIFDHAFEAGLLQRKPLVIPISSSEYPTPAKRPCRSVLDNRGFEERFGVMLPAWQHGLAGVIRHLRAAARSG